MISIFICTTQLHIILATMLVNGLKYNTGQKKVLLVDAHRESIIELLTVYYESLNKIWDEVHLVNYHNYDVIKSVNKCKFINALNDINHLVNIKKEIKSFFNLYKIEDILDIYISTGPGGSYITEQIVSYANKNNFPLYVIEDGLSTYTYTVGNMKKTRIVKSKLKKLLNYSAFSYESAKRIFVLNKNVYVGDRNIEDKLVNIKKSKSFDFEIESSLLESINSTPIIYFSQNYYSVDIEKRILNDLFNEYCYYFKKHPSSLSKTDSMNKLDLLPWEIWCSLVNDKIFFITISSTAALTPLLLYNKKNKVIFLYKILEKEISQGINDFFIKIKNEYKDQIFVPENKEQLKQLLEKFK